MPRFKILTFSLLLVHAYILSIQHEIQFENRQLHGRVFDESATHFADARFTNASLSAGDVHVRVVTLAISCTLSNSQHSNVAISPSGISVFWDMRRISISPTFLLPVFDYIFFLLYGLFIKSTCSLPMYFSFYTMMNEVFAIVINYETVS